MADEPIRIQFDQERMTLGEMVDFEDIAGVAITNIPPGTVPNSRMVLAIVYISMRRNDPRVTLDYVKSLDYSAVDFVDPTEAEPTPLAKLDQPVKAAPRRAKAS